MKSLVKNSLFNILYTLLNIIFPFITSIHLSNVLLAEGIGRVGYAQSIASYFLSIASLGMQVYGVKEIAKAKDDGEQRSRIFSSLIAINTVSTFVSVVVYYFLIFLSGNIGEDRGLLIICGLGIVFNFINIDWLYQGLEEYGYITLRSLVVKIVMLAVTLLCVRGVEDVYIYALITVFAGGGNYLFNVFQLRKHTRLDFRKIEIKKHLKPVFFLAICQFLSTLYHKVDITMLGWIIDKKSVAYYTYGHTIINIITSICVAITGVFLPKLSVYYNEDKEKFSALISKGIKVLFFICLPATVGCYLLAEDVILLLYGQEFFLSVECIKLFTPLILLNPLGNLIGYQAIISMGEQEKRVPVFILCSLINIVLNLFLIPRFYQAGATVASVVSEAVMFIWQYLYLRKKVKFRFFDKDALKALFSTIIMGIVVLFIGKNVSSLLLNIIFSFFSGVSIYLVLCYVLRHELLKSLFENLKTKVFKVKNDKKSIDEKE